MTDIIKELLEQKEDNYILPFFWQHGESEETLREYMNAIYNANIRAVCVESRPHPDFCGDKWWHDMDIILDEAKKKSMKVWILDDSHFPTGYANGAMKEKPVELRRQSICCQIIDTKDKERISLKEELLHPLPFERTMVEQYVLPKELPQFEDDHLLSVYALEIKENRRIDLIAYIKEGKLNWTVPKGEWKIYILHTSKNFGYHRDYINMMDKESCRVLIDAVYEPHYRHYKEEFGKTIAGFFSDEPELGNGHLYEVNDGFPNGSDYPWSRELEEKLKEDWGDDYGLYLGGLWDDNVPEVEKIRYAYMNGVTELVKHDFSKQIGNWCRQHGVEYIGHLIEDDNHHAKTGSSLGHYFRGLAGQDMAGIDDIGGQVFPQGEDICYDKGIFEHRNGQFYHYMLGKLASSAAAIEPAKHGNSMCEIFGNYGWSEGVRLEKYLADHFLVRGINHFVPHAFSGKEYPDPDCPPHFYAHGHNPQYRHFGCLMSYMNRVCHLISNGKHIAKVGVLYHGEGEWTGEHMTSDAIGHVLSDAQVEYDYLPQDVFAYPKEYQMEYLDGKLKINTQEYEVILVPYMEFVTKAFAKSVELLTKHHVKVLFVNRYPKGICDDFTSYEKTSVETIKRDADCVTLDKVVESLLKIGAYEVKLSPKNNRIRYIHYVQKNGVGVWMFVNEGSEVFEGELESNSFEKATKEIYEYDAWDNTIKEVVIDHNKIMTRIEPFKSVIYIEDYETNERELSQYYKNRYESGGDWKVINTSESWRRSICRSIEYPNFEKEKMVTLPDNLCNEEPMFSGFCRYENRFWIEDEKEIWLIIEDAAEGVEVFLNGKSLGIQIAAPFRYNLSKEVVSGENELVIEVATTLERENSGKPDAYGNMIEATAKSGVTGNILIMTKIKI
ncbi:MAG: hypothetical protein K6F30_10120 [Lachnospiraceae bacterium]|nr:hypothetical protein [Lachnospiraceae bacterium]